MISSVEASVILSVSQRRVRALCARGQLPGAHRVGKDWRIPITAVQAYWRSPRKRGRPRKLALTA